MRIPAKGEAEVVAGARWHVHIHHERGIYCKQVAKNVRNVYRGRDC